MSLALILSADRNVLSLCSQACSNYGMASQSSNHAEAATISESCDIALIDTRSPWSETQSILTTLSSREIPVLFMAPSTENIRHLQNLYLGPCKVCLLNAPVDELVASIDQFLNPEVQIIQVRDLCMDVVRHSLTRNDQELHLTVQEFRLLHVLFRSPGEPVSRDQLLREAWGYSSSGIITRSVDITIQRLRRKIGDGYIITVPKMGYKIQP